MLRILKISICHEHWIRTCWFSHSQRYITIKSQYENHFSDSSNPYSRNFTCPQGVFKTSVYFAVEKSNFCSLTVRSPLCFTEHLRIAVSSTTVVTFLELISSKYGLSLVPAPANVEEILILRWLKLLSRDACRNWKSFSI